MRGAFDVPSSYRVAALGALLLGALAWRRTPQSSTPTPAGSSGKPINDQGSNYNYRSNITGVVPSVPGLSLKCWSSPTGWS